MSKYAGTVKTRGTLSNSSLLKRRCRYNCQRWSWFCDPSFNRESYHFHSLRVHLECMRLSLFGINWWLDPCLRERERKYDTSKPIKTDKPFASELLFKLIWCITSRPLLKNSCGTQIFTCMINGLPWEVVRDWPVTLRLENNHKLLKT